VTYVYGVDGCKGGWCAVRLDVEDERITPQEPEILSFNEIIASGAAVIGIDIPIGLLDVPGVRGCDTEARRLIRPPRSSSVFPAPSRQVLPFCVSPDGYSRACEVNEQLTGQRLTKQTFAIAPKIKEVDDAMTPALQDRVGEVHPELCFWALNSRESAAHNKKSVTGRHERWALLRDVIQSLGPEPRLPSDTAQRCAMDDYIDAMVAAWTAVCIFRGKATRVPATPARDDRGLRMEMWLPDDRIYGSELKEVDQRLTDNHEEDHARRLSDPHGHQKLPEVHPHRPRRDARKLEERIRNG
jgi:predicted RNase H-like nuclease